MKFGYCTGWLRHGLAAAGGSCGRGELRKEVLLQHEGDSPLTKEFLILRGRFQDLYPIKINIGSIWRGTHFPSDGAVLAFSGNILPPEEKNCKLRGRGVPTILTDSLS